MAPEARVTFINPESLPTPAGYSHVGTVQNSRLIHISGQVPVDRHGNLIGQGDVAAQAEQVFQNIDAALQAAGATFADVVKLGFYLVDITQIPAVRAVRDRYINTQNPPTSTAVEVRRLVNEHWLIEIEAVAAVAL